MACQPSARPNFACTSKGMGLLYRNLWGVGLSKKRVGINGLHPRGLCKGLSP